MWARDNIDLYESKAFLDGPEVKKLIKNVSKAVGSDKLLPISKF